MSERTIIVLSAIPAVTRAVAWIAYLIFLLRVVKQTNNSKSLTHTATAIRAFKAGHGGMLQSLARIIKRR